MKMNVNYTVKGQGKQNIILLHGWGGSLKSLSSLQDQLIKSSKFRVYNLELPGFGDSPILNKDAKLENYVSFLEKFISENNLIKPIMIGHSFGGKIIMKTAISNPELLDKLVLINVSGLKPKNSIKKLAFIVPTKIFGAIFSLPLLSIFKQYVRKVYYKILVREGDYLYSSEMVRVMKNVLKENLDDQIDRIKNETLIIWGEKDNKTPLWMGKLLEKKIVNSKLEVIKDAHHNLPLVQPEIVATLITLFIK